MEPSLDLLPQLHSPGRSRTVSAWSALIALLLLITFSFFYSFLLKKSVSALLLLSRPFTGITIQAELIKVKLGEPLYWKNIVITSGPPPHQSRLELQTLSLELSSPWRIFVGDHLLIKKLEAGGGKGLIDLRHEASFSKPSFFQQKIAQLHEVLQQGMIELPASIALHDISLLCITENQRYSVDHFSCSLPHKEFGKLSYESILLEAGTVKCHLFPTSCDAFWDGKTMIIKNLPLAEEITLRHLQVTPHLDHLELGFAATVFSGLLRADGCLRRNGCEPTLEGALLGQQLPMERISKFLGLRKKISGTLREGRLIFRGSPFRPIDAEASLRMLVDHFRLEKKDWASLSIACNLIGRKISVTNFQLNQQENHLNVIGEMSLPEEWHNIGRAPFHLKLGATIADATQLTDLIGPPWNDITGKIFMDGDLHGAANRAEGYLHLQGLNMTLNGLPMDVVESTLLFQGEKTTLTNLDLWNRNDHLQLSGTVANGWPHEYQTQGIINCHDFFEKLHLLAKSANRDDPQYEPVKKTTTAANAEQFSKKTEEWMHPFIFLTALSHRFQFLENIRSGFLRAEWHGHGTATTHEGAFTITLTDAIYDSQGLQLHSSGSYTPNALTSPVVKIDLGSKTFSTSLSLSSHTIELRNLKIQENKKTTLSGFIALPLDGIGLLGFFNGNTFVSLFQWDTPMDLNIALHHFSLGAITSLIGLPTSDAFVDGIIKAYGPWSEPSIDMLLQGARITSTSKKHSPFHLQLTAKKGEGFIDASLCQENEESIHLRGTLPCKLTHLEEGPPL